MSHWDDSILRLALDKLEKPEIIDIVVSTIKALCADNDKGLKDITHSILCYGQVKEIMAGKSDLAAYQEPHRTELFEQLLRHILPPVDLHKQTAAILYSDYNSSKLRFTEWAKTLRDPT